VKIVFLDRKTLGDDITLDQFDQYGDMEVFSTTKPEQTLDRVKDAIVVVTNKVVIDKNIMDNSNIKLICVAATGMNNIDLEYAKQKGILVKNVSGYSTSSVVQLTLSFVLQFVQKIEYYDSFAKNEWKNSEIFTNIDKPFFELDGKKWGIIGLGAIGKKLGLIATAIGCEVSYYSTSGKNNNNQYEQLDLDKLLNSCDIITIHAPLNDQTNNLINIQNIRNIKKGAIVLNLGRGGIVNEKDISDAINDGVDLYYGTDVVTKEPIELDSPLLNIKNKDRILLTPHIAWASKEARLRLLDGIEQNIKNFI